MLVRIQLFRLPDINDQSLLSKIIVPRSWKKKILLKIVQRSPKEEHGIHISGPEGLVYFQRLVLPAAGS